jgi:hypothetical protein
VGVTNNRAILLENIPDPLRLVCYQNPETGKEYHFVTNADHLDAKTLPISTRNGGRSSSSSNGSSRT